MAASKNGVMAARAGSGGMQAAAWRNGGIGGSIMAAYQRGKAKIKRRRLNGNMAALAASWRRVSENNGGGGEAYQAMARTGSGMKQAQA